MSKKEIKKITNDETYRVSMKRLADRPNSSSAQGRGGMSSAELKAYMDKYPELLKAKLDELIDLCNGASGENLLNILHTSVTDDTTGEEKTLAEWIPEIVAYVEAIKGKDGIGHFAQVDLENEPTEDNDAVTLAYFRDHSQSTDYVDKVIGEAKRDLDVRKLNKNYGTARDLTIYGATIDDAWMGVITPYETQYNIGGGWVGKAKALRVRDELRVEIRDADGSYYQGVSLTGGGEINARNVSVSEKLEAETVAATDVNATGKVSAETVELNRITGNGQIPKVNGAMDFLQYGTDVTRIEINGNDGTVFCSRIRAKGDNVNHFPTEIDGNTVLNGDVQAKANLTVGGNLEVKGSTFTVDSETLRVKDKIIEVGKDNTTTLIGYAGIAVPKYDGTNDGALVYDSTGTAYVGDARINSDGSISDVDMKPLVTRADTMTDGAYPVWDNATKSVKSGVIKSGSGTNAIVVGDYNQAISENTIAFGTSNIAGLKGYKWSEINFTNRTITLATAHTGGTAVQCEYAVGDVISIVNQNRYDLCSKITAVNGSVITVDTLPFTAVATKEDEEDAYTIWCIAKPSVGAFDMGASSAVFGDSIEGSNSCSMGIGRGHSLNGKYSVATGLLNRSGYCCFATGRENEAIAPYALVSGNKNEVLQNGAGASVIGGVNNSMNARQGAIIGGSGNTNNGAVAVIAGGQDNTIGIGYSGIIASQSSEISGSGHHSVIAGGHTNVATHPHCFVHGFHLNTGGEYQEVAGRWNVDTNAARVVGGGTSATSRKNIEVLDWAGNLTLTGGLTLGKAPSNDMEAATKKYVDDKVSAIPTFKTMTQAQYDALSTKDANTLYLIVG